MKLALYGGSFDPIHCGHLMLAQEAKAQAKLDRVILLPCHQSPLKARGPVASGEDRLAMARLAAAELSRGPDWLEVSDWELLRSGPSFSWQTAQHFATKFPQAQLYWILGHDQWEALPRWAEPGKLAELLTFLVFARSYHHPQPQPPFRHQFLAGEHDISSTQLRQALLHGAAISQTEMPLSVQAYAKQRGLYSSSGQGDI